MLQISQLTLHLGERTLFNEISTLINPGERVGLVGPNGAGKSTLLKVIAGQMNWDEGEIVLGNKATVGYLPQDGVEPDPACTVFEEVEREFQEILSIRDEVKTLQLEMEQCDPESREGREKLERMGKMQDRLEQSRAYTLGSDIERVLDGLGFAPEDLTRPVTEFSGGWLMRIALAKLLLKSPTYLLLDEPTNHLDIESLQWMESFLSNYDGGVIIVSHDRAFLDSVTRRTLSLENGRLGDYAGNYSFFETKKEQEQEQLRNEYENQQKQIRQTEEFIDRFRYKASKAKQVQSRIKQLEKMERITLDESQEEISFRFPQPDRSGQVVMELSGAGKSYGENRIFDQVEYQLERGDKVAVVGPNGAGKSTLIRILAGHEPLTEGKRIEGHNVTVSYFAQHQADELNPANSVLEEMNEHAAHLGETRIRSLLGSFLFTGDDVYKKIRVLSGGEKSRVALARMLIIPANFMILDEPTNHLDMQSKQILRHALEQYEGTCMIVSHDRAFLDPIVNKTLEVQPGKIKTWPGNVTDYLERRSAREKPNDKGGQSSSSPEGISRKEERRIRAQQRQARSSRINPLKKRLQSLEKEIGKAEQRRGEIEEIMADPAFYDDPEQVKSVSLEYEELKGTLAESYNKWEEVAARIEYLESELEV